MRLSLICIWFDKRTTNGFNKLPIVLSLSKDLIRGALNERDDVVQPRARITKLLRRACFPRVRRSTTMSPVKRLWLMAKNEAPLIVPARNVQRERIPRVRYAGSHWQPNEDAGARIKCLRRENEQRMHVAHAFANFASQLTVAIYPDDLTAIRHPCTWGPARRSQMASAPTRPNTANSPPCFFGSNAASFSVSVNLRGAADSMMTREPSTDTLTSVSACKPAARATFDVKRTPRPLPHCLILTAASM